MMDGSSCGESMQAYLSCVLLFKCTVTCFAELPVFFPRCLEKFQEIPEELSRWVKRGSNLRYDICKLLRGKQFSFFFFFRNLESSFKL